MKKCLAFSWEAGSGCDASRGIAGSIRSRSQTGSLGGDIHRGNQCDRVGALGVNLAGGEALEHAYQRVADFGLMDPRLIQFVLNAISRRPNLRGSRFAREFLIAEGINPRIPLILLLRVSAPYIPAHKCEGFTVRFGNFSVSFGFWPKIDASKCH